MERDTAIANEVHAILMSPTFIRSKAMSGLLSFLLEFNLEQSRPPTQADIAADYLGKDLSSFDAADSSVRVAMTRLRKALKDYYIIHQPKAERCIYFDKGDYRLRFGKLAKAYPDLEKFGNRILVEETKSDPNEPQKTTSINNYASIFSLDGSELITCEHKNLAM